MRHFVQVGTICTIQLQDRKLKLNFTANNTPPWMFVTYFKFYKWYHIAQSIKYIYWICLRHISPSFCEYICLISFDMYKVSSSFITQLCISCFHFSLLNLMLRKEYVTPLSAVIAIRQILQIKSGGNSSPDMVYSACQQ